ncbi:hypothetical protein [Nakamurella sp.]|uniref:hypothetical protein n=1 Tax=Nakamurella sp. TaxID=1869182 RepID=UPI0037842A75
MTDQMTLARAVARLDDIERTGFANGARINAESHGPRGRRFWLSLADMLDDPSSAADDALRAAAADMNERAREVSARLFTQQRNVAVEEGRHIMAEVLNEVFCLLFEVSSEQRAAFEAVRNSFHPPCEKPG